MSLFKVNKLTLQTKLNNVFVGHDWLDIGTSDKLGINPDTGKRYKFSEWWSENNVFHTGLNKFTGEIRCTRYHKRRPHIFQTCKTLSARARLK